MSRRSPLVEILTKSIQLPNLQSDQSVQKVGRRDNATEASQEKISTSGQEVRRKQELQYLAMLNEGYVPMSVLVVLFAEEGDQNWSENFNKMFISGSRKNLSLKDFLLNPSKYLLDQEQKNHSGQEEMQEQVSWHSRVLSRFVNAIKGFMNPHSTVSANSDKINGENSQKARSGITNWDDTKIWELQKLAKEVFQQTLNSSLPNAIKTLSERQGGPEDAINEAIANALDAQGGPNIGRFGAGFMSLLPKKPGEMLELISPKVKIKIVNKRGEFFVKFEEPKPGTQFRSQGTAVVKTFARELASYELQRIIDSISERFEIVNGYVVVRDGINNKRHNYGIGPHSRVADVTINNVHKNGQTTTVVVVEDNSNDPVTATKFLDVMIHPGKSTKNKNINSANSSAEQGLKLKKLPAIVEKGKIYITAPSGYCILRLETNPDRGSIQLVLPSATELNLTRSSFKLSDDILNQINEIIYNTETDINTLVNLAYVLDGLKRGLEIQKTSPIYTILERTMNNLASVLDDSSEAFYPDHPNGKYLKSQDNSICLPESIYNRLERKRPGVTLNELDGYEIRSNGAYTIRLVDNLPVTCVRIGNTYYWDKEIFEQLVKRGWIELANMMMSSIDTHYKSAAKVTGKQSSGDSHIVLIRKQQDQQSIDGNNSSIAQSDLGTNINFGTPTDSTIISTSEPNIEDIHWSGKPHEIAFRITQILSYANNLYDFEDANTMQKVLDIAKSLLERVNTSKDMIEIISNIWTSIDNLVQDGNGKNYDEYDAFELFFKSININSSPESNENVFDWFIDMVKRKVINNSDNESKRTYTRLLSAFLENPTFAGFCHSEVTQQKLLSMLCELLPMYEIKDSSFTVYCGAQFYVHLMKNPLLFNENNINSIEQFILNLLHIVLTRDGGKPIEYAYLIFSALMENESLGQWLANSKTRDLVSGILNQVLTNNAGKPIAGAHSVFHSLMQNRSLVSGLLGNQDVQTWVLEIINKVFQGNNNLPSVDIVFGLMRNPSLDILLKNENGREFFDGVINAIYSSKSVDPLTKISALRFFDYNCNREKILGDREILKYLDSLIISRLNHDERFAYFYNLMTDSDLYNFCENDIFRRWILDWISKYRSELANKYKADKYKADKYTVISNIPKLFNALEKYISPKDLVDIYKLYPIIFYIRQEEGKIKTDDLDKLDDNDLIRFLYYIRTRSGEQPYSLEEDGTNINEQIVNKELMYLMGLYAEKYSVEQGIDNKLKDKNEIEKVRNLIENLDYETKRYILFRVVEEADIRDSEVKQFFQTVLQVNNIDKLIKEADIGEEDLETFLKRRGFDVNLNLMKLALWAQTANNTEDWIRELIQNARDATLQLHTERGRRISESAAIEINVGMVDGRVSLRITDHAMGMSPEKIAGVLLRPLKPDVEKIQSGVAEGGIGWGFWTVLQKADFVDLVTIQNGKKTTLRIVVDRDENDNITSIKISNYEEQEVNNEPTGTSIQVYLHHRSNVSPTVQCVNVLIEALKNSKLISNYKQPDVTQTDRTKQDDRYAIPIRINGNNVIGINKDQVGDSIPFQVDGETYGEVRVYRVNNKEYPYSVATKRGLLITSIEQLGLLDALPPYIRGFYERCNENFIIELPEGIILTADRAGIAGLSAAQIDLLKTTVLRVVLQDICRKIINGENVEALQIPDDYLTTDTAYFGLNSSERIKKITDTINAGRRPVNLRELRIEDLPYVLENIKFPSDDGDSITINEIRQKIRNGEYRGIGAMLHIETQRISDGNLITDTVQEPIFTDNEVRNNPSLRALQILLQMWTDILFPGKSNLIEVRLNKKALGTYWKQNILGMPLTQYYTKLPDPVQGEDYFETLRRDTPDVFMRIVDVFVHEMTHVIEGYLQGMLYQGKSGNFRGFLEEVLMHKGSDNELLEMAAKFFNQSGDSRVWSHTQSDESGFGKIYKSVLARLIKLLVTDSANAVV